MKTFTYTITDELGIHARPAGMITKLTKEYESKITIGRPDKMVDAARVIGIMGLCMKQGDEITVIAEGVDEDAAATAMEALLKENL